MKVHQTTISLATQGNLDMHDLTAQVAEIVARTEIGSGLATIFVPGSTGGLTTIEFEAGALADLRRALERLAPADLEYAHDRRWGDGNGHSHVRAALLGPDLQVPVTGGRLCLGTWQQIVFVDCDNRPRRREIVVQVIGNEKGRIA